MSQFIILKSSGWWFGTFFYFSIYKGNNDPNWRTHIFQRGRLNHQPVMGVLSFFVYLPGMPHSPIGSHWLINSSVTSQQPNYCEDPQLDRCWWLSQRLCVYGRSICSIPKEEGWIWASKHTMWCPAVICYACWLLNLNPINYRFFDVLP